MTLDQINNYLARDYGYFDGHTPHWRVVYSDDQFEKRLTEYTKEGLELLVPQVVEVPKYKQYIQDKYILERALGIPEFVETDLVSKWSYEPVHTFGIGKNEIVEFADDFYEAIRFIIHTVYSASAGYLGVKYKNPEDVDPKDAPEAYKLRIKRLQDELFPDETETGDALRYREGIVVPNSYGVGTAQKE
jgi:hypothetical protein